MRFGFLALMFLFFLVPGVSSLLGQLCFGIMRGVAYIFGAPFGI